MLDNVEDEQAEEPRRSLGIADYSLPKLYEKRVGRGESGEESRVKCSGIKVCQHRNSFLGRSVLVLILILLVPVARAAIALSSKASPQAFKHGADFSWI